jgi:hypothetical protein
VWNARIILQIVNNVEHQRIITSSTQLGGSDSLTFHGYMNHDLSLAMIIGGTMKDNFTIDNVINVVVCGDNARITCNRVIPYYGVFGSLTTIIVDTLANEEDGTDLVDINMAIVPSTSLQISSVIAMLGNGDDTILCDHSFHTIVFGDYGSIEYQYIIPSSSSSNEMILHIPPSSSASGTGHDLLQMRSLSYGSVFTMGCGGDDTIHVSCDHGFIIVAGDNSFGRTSPSLQFTSQLLGDGDDNIMITGMNQTGYILAGAGDDVVNAPSMNAIIVIGDLGTLSGPNAFGVGLLPIEITTAPSSTTSSINDGDDTISVELPSIYNQTAASIAMIISGSGNDRVFVNGAVTTHICADDCYCK